MDWNAPLSRLVRTSTHQLRSELSSLGEALDMIDEDLPEHLRERPHWQLARERLIRAAESVSQDDIQEATLQVMVALSVDFTSRKPSRERQLRWRSMAKLRNREDVTVPAWLEVLRTN